MEDLLARSLGLRDVQAVEGGFQSLGVFAAQAPGERVVVKVVEAQDVDPSLLAARVRMLSALGAADAQVCAPVPLDGRLINELRHDGADLYAVAYQFAPGEAPQLTDRNHVRSMGATLARLHTSLASLPPFELPALHAFPPLASVAEVAARLGISSTDLVDPRPHEHDGHRQLLHGDFSSANVRQATGRIRVFDFDDCGYGPIELDVALSLYMVLFDAMTGPDPDLYQRFRSDFLAGYRAQSGVSFSDRRLDQLVTYRVLVLASWLAHPDTAPPGIRNSSDDWRTTLYRFVENHVETRIQPSGSP